MTGNAKPPSSTAVLVSGTFVACGLFAVAAAQLFSGRYQAVILPNAVIRIDALTGKLSSCAGSDWIKGATCTPFGTRDLSEVRAESAAAQASIEQSRLIEQAMRETAAEYEAEKQQSKSQTPTEPLHTAK